MEAKLISINKKCRECGSDDIALRMLKKSDFLCKGCSKIKAKKYYLENREKFLAQAQGQYREADKSHGTKKWATMTLANFRYHERLKGLYPVCDLQALELLELIKAPCFYCEDVIDRRSLDRIDNRQGHVKANIVPSCYLCNSFRMDNLTHGEMKLVGPVIKKIKQERRGQ